MNLDDIVNLSEWPWGGVIVGFVDHLGGAGRGAEVTVSYRGFRFPAEVIAYAVWLHHRFPLSFREVGELLLTRGIVVSHETIRVDMAAWGEVHDIVRSSIRETSAAWSDYEVGGRQGRPRSVRSRSR